jgi:predicted TIM-barrel fold metal-dependent hydrolase
MHTDVHQHLWTEPLLAALGQRDRLPFVRRTDGRCIIHLAGEPPSAIDLDGEQPEYRADLVSADGLNRALIALSSPLGIEALPRSEAQGLINAYLDGVAALPSRFGAWGPVALEDATGDDVDAVLARGCVGVSLPAGALGRPAELAAIAPVLERLQQRDAPLFIHPGPGLHDRLSESPLTDPLWWPALTRYVAQMQAAWLTFVSVGRREYPRLRILFAMLAGGAPLLAERLRTRGGPNVDLRDPLTFYDNSSFGPDALKAFARIVGAEQVLYGSDRPVLEPLEGARDVLLWSDSERLLAVPVVAP